MAISLPTNQPVLGPDSPDNRSETSLAFAQRLLLVRSLQGGTRRMRLEAEVWLPRHPREEDAHYLQRLNGTFLFNVFERACKDISAKPFASVPSIQGMEGNSQVKALVDDCDQQGTNLQTFGRQWLNEGVRAGECYLLVTFPKAQTVANLYEERKLGLRPSFMQLLPENILDLHEEIQGGRRIFTHLRYVTGEIVRDGKFGNKFIKKIMVIEPKRWAEYREEVVGGWVLFEEGVHNLDQVPLVRLTVGERDDTGLVKSVFEDLAWKNIEHWQSSSEQRNILRYGRFPMLAAKGYKPPSPGPDGANPDGTSMKKGTLEVGPGKILVTPADGEFYYVEPQGNAIQAGERDIAHIEKEMEYLAMKPRVDARSLITATGAAIEEVDENNVVKAMALMAAAALSQAMWFAGQWLGEDWSKVIVGLNGDFEISSDRGQSIETILRLLDAMEISPTLALNELRVLGVFRTQFKVDEVVTAAEAVKEQWRVENPGEPRPGSQAGSVKRLPGSAPGNVAVGSQK